VHGERNLGDPMRKCFAKSDSIVSRRIAGEFILVPIRKRGEDVDSIYTLNEVGARIWELLDGERSVENIRDQIAAEYDVTPEEAEQDIAELLLQFESVGALKEV
jgi:hypothetical protein